MAAKFSTKERDRRLQQERQEREERIKKKHGHLLTQRLEAIKLLRANSWRVTVHGDHDARELPDDTLRLDVHFEVKPPGAASMIVRGLESLVRKTKGMS